MGLFDVAADIEAGPGISDDLLDHTLKSFSLSSQDGEHVSESLLVLGCTFALSGKEKHFPQLGLKIMTLGSTIQGSAN